MADKEEKRIINPIVFMDDKKDFVVNPIYMIDNTLNTVDRFVIVATTDNGKWIRGSSLYYKINGVEIYTDINNAIFVDLVSNVVFIKEANNVMEQIKPVDPEERQYILLMYNDGLDSGDYRWESIVGRQETYKWIKENIDIYEFDPTSSLVMTDNVAFKDALTISKFVKYIQNAGFVPEDDFDIEQYEDLGGF